MSCCSNKKKFHKIHPEPKSILKNYKKKKSIIPQKNNIRREMIKDNKNKLIEKNKQQEEFRKHFVSEIIQCGACFDKFTLKQNAIKINCNSCNKFYHCHIAGACVGPNCSVILDGKKESLKYCMQCVNQNLKINYMNNGKSLCRLCENDKDTDKVYLKV